MLLLKFDHHLTQDCQQGLSHCTQACKDVTQCCKHWNRKKTGKTGTTDIKPRGSTAAALLRLQAESRAGKAERDHPSGEAALGAAEHHAGTEFGGSGAGEACT